MKKQIALDYLLGTAWAITPEALENMAEIAARQNEYAGNLEALEAKLGRKLENTRAVTVREGVAVIPVAGPLFKRASMFDAISGATDYRSIALDLSAAIENPNVSGIMLTIDSPGGQVDGLADLAAMVRASAKPVRVHTDGTMASAAFWLGSAASHISASETAVIGSVGVMMGLTRKEPKAGEKSFSFISSQSPLKNADPETDAGAQQIQTMVDDLGAVFLSTAANYRGVDLKAAAENFGKGGVMVAAKAVTAGMIDGISTFENAFSDFKKELKGMDYSGLTAAALAENRADLVASIESAAVAKAAAAAPKIDAEAIKAEAVTAERARIAALDDLAVAGAESVIAACKADGTTAEAAAMKVVAHLKATTTTANTTAMENIIAAEKEMQKPKALPQNEQQTEEEKGRAMMAGLRAAGAIR